MTKTKEQPRASTWSTGALPGTTASGAGEREASEWCALLERLEPTLAHDLRGPLNAVTLHLELLRRVTAGLDAGPPAERVRRSVESLEHEIERLTHRIEGVLRLIGSLRDSPSSFTVAALLRECEDDLRTTARHRGVALRVEEAPEDSVHQREALRRALLLMAFDALERSGAGDSLVLSGVLRGGWAELKVDAVAGASGAKRTAEPAGTRPPEEAPDAGTLARTLVGRCGGELERTGSSWRLRFPVEVET